MGPHVWTYRGAPEPEFSDGFEVLHVLGSQPVTVEAVRSVGGETALKNLGARIGLPGRKYDFQQLMTGFPPNAIPASLQVDANGATLMPGDSYQLIMGYRLVDMNVQAKRTAIEIDYRIGDDLYTSTILARLNVCPAARSEEECGN
jgi:hypothetical protein